MFQKKKTNNFFSFVNRVVSLSICPTEERFLTSSIDNTLRLWDVRIPTAQGLLNIQPSPTGPTSRPIANFDPEGTLQPLSSLPYQSFVKNLGVVFAAGIQSSQIKLYDIRHFDKVCHLTDR